MRQKFDIGDLVSIRIAGESVQKCGVVLQKGLINNNMLNPEQWMWHTDEYDCRVRLVNGEDHWVRAKWLEHIATAKQQERQISDRSI